MSIIENYLEFLIGRKFISNEINTTKPVVNEEKYGKRIINLSKIGVFKYELKYDENGESLLKLCEIDANKLQEIVFKRMRELLYDFSYLLAQSAKIILINNELSLLLPDNDDSKQLKLSTEKISWKQGEYLKVKVDTPYDFTEISERRKTHINAITGLKLKETYQPQDIVSVMPESGEAISLGDHLYKSHSISASSSYYVWLTQELKKLQEIGHFRFSEEHDGSSGESIFYLSEFNGLFNAKITLYSNSDISEYKKASILNPSPIPQWRYKDAKSFANLLQLLLRVNFMPSISGNYLSNPAEVEIIPYIQKKLAQYSQILTHTFHEKDNRFQVFIADKEGLLKLCFRKLNLGKKYLENIFGIYAFIRLDHNYKDYNFSNDKEIYPNIIFERLSIQNIKEEELEKYKQFINFSSYDDYVGISKKVTWFDEEQLYKWAHEKHVENMGLLNKVLKKAEFKVEFNKFIVPLTYVSPTIDNFLRHVKEGKSYLLKAHSADRDKCVYYTTCREKKVIDKLTLFLKYLDSKSGISCEIITSAQTNETTFKIKIFDIKELEKDAEEFKKNPPSSDKENCLVM